MYPLKIVFYLRTVVKGPFNNGFYLRTVVKCLSKMILTTVVDTFSNTSLITVGESLLKGFKNRY
jgi:hypothetical protein